MKIKKQIIEDLQNAGLFTDVEYELACDVLFLRSDSIRLRYQGHKLLSNCYEVYTFPVEKHMLLPRHYIALSREFEFPYYLGKSDITVYSSYDASMITLCGSLQKFLERIDIV